MTLKNTLEEKKDLITKNGKLEFDLESLRNSESRQLNQLRAEYEGQLSMLKQEVERLTRDRKDFELRYARLESEYSADHSKLIQYSQELERVGKEYSMVNSRLGEIDQLGRVNADLQAKLSRALAEKKTVEDEFASQQREFTLTGQRFTSEMNEYRRQASVVAEENNLLKRRLQEFGDISRKITEYESRITIMAKENERLADTLRQMDGEYQNKNSIYIRKEEEFTRRLQELESHFRQLQSQYDKERSAVEGLSRENSSLQQRLAEADQLRKAVSELQNNLLAATREKQEILNEHRLAQ